MTTAVTSKPTTAQTDMEARTREIIAENARLRAAALALSGGPQGAAAGGSSLRERITRQATSAVRRDFFPSGGQSEDGPLADLSPSRRVLAAHVAAALDRDPNMASRSVSPGSYAPMAMVRSFMGGSGQRFNTGATAGIGAELVDSMPVAEIWKSAMCESGLLDMFDPQPLRGGVLKVVNLSGSPTVYSTPSAADCAEMECRTSSPIGTRTHEHTAGKLTVDVCMPVELTEDSFLDAIDEYGQIAEDSMRIAQELAVIRGDTTLGVATTNINNFGAAVVLAATGQGPSYAVFDGIAHATLIDNTANNYTAAGLFTAGDSIVADDIMKLRALMWDAASQRHFGFCDPSQLMVIVDAQTYAKLVTLDDVKWVEKFGAGATIVTGVLPTIWGIPIYMSPALPLTDGAGKVDIVTPGNNIYGQLHLVNRSGFRVGVARDMQVLTETDKRCDVVHVYITWRAAFARRSSAATAAGIEAVASIYGIAAA